MAGARWAVNCILLAALASAGCRLGAPGAAGPEAAPSVMPSASARPLVIFIRVEPATLATRSFVRKSAGLFLPWRIFNALPALVDARGVPQPELLSSLPSLNTDSWQVFADGTMQTTYTLRPNLAWLPRVSLYFPAGPFAHVAGLQGPAIVVPESRVAWNVHRWDFK